MKKGFLLAGDKDEKQDGKQPAASADVKDASVQPPADSPDVKGAVEKRYTQAEINHFVARLQTMRALGVETYMTESGLLFDRNELEEII
ncbi:unnamed protein product, partial [Symbiodinium sp. CCMP2456]